MEKLTPNIMFRNLTSYKKLTIHLRTSALRGPHRP